MHMHMPESAEATVQKTVQPPTSITVTKHLQVLAAFCAIGIEQVFAQEPLSKPQKSTQQDSRKVDGVSLQKIIQPNVPNFETEQFEEVEQQKIHDPMEMLEYIWAVNS